MAKKKEEIIKDELDVEPKFKFWLESSKGYVIGEGRAELLRCVRKLGSLNRAASELEMSYRAAWGAIRTMEQRLGIKLLDRTRGGKDGGGAVLTEEASDLLAQFDVLEKKLKKFFESESGDLLCCFGTKEPKSAPKPYTKKKR